MFETTGFYKSDTNGLMRFNVKGRDSNLLVVHWQCPPGRLHEFGALTKVRVTLDDSDRVVNVEVLAD